MTGHVAGHVVWGVAAAFLMVLGVVAAMFAASSVAEGDAARERQAFRTSAAQIASNLQLGIQHEEDLMISASGFLAENPDATNTELGQWATSVHALERYPEVQSIAHVMIVPAAGLTAFAARAVIDPAGPLAPDRTFKVVPSGIRPYYCLSMGGISKDPGARPPAGFDFCPTSARSSALILARDAGQTGYYPFKLADDTMLSIVTPVYSGGLVPLTVSGRRAAFLGCIKTEIVPKVVLDRALQSHPGMSVALHHQLSSSPVVFSSGATPVGSESVTTELGDGWKVQTFAVVTTGGVFTDQSTLMVLSAGVLMSLLLSVLVFVLGTSRARALRLVAERTQIATHDALTGLPNRLLFADRAAQVLATARQTGSRPAVLMLDLDRFKEVNDTLGHLHGDRLLIQVAERLTALLRPGDTVARFGGDEFVLLLSDGGPEAGAEVASRIATAVEAPFVLGDPVLNNPVLNDPVLSDPGPSDSITGHTIPCDTTINIEVSIGVSAAAPHEQSTLEELLRQADVAMYSAKTDRCGFAQFATCDSAPPNRLRLVGELRQALDRSELVVYYQPDVAIETDEPPGVVALLRWQHPTRGLLLPPELITQADGSSLRSVGVDLAAGYDLGHPMPDDLLQRWIEDRPGYLSASAASGTEG